MDEIFNPSLLISLGPSGRRALNFSEKLLSYLPSYFLNVVDYYSVENIENVSEEIQAIVDNKLLSAKHLNKLVDLGYKVRSENVSSVKLNIYLLWDVYNSEQSAYEVVKTLTNLNYGNIDKDQHSGVSLFMLPIMDKEWLLEDKNSLESIRKLNRVIDFISQQESILSLDSKVYMLHCVSNDGTRIPKEELENICGILAYLNILPSKDPPLSHFNRRLLMEESSYKVGTIGITTLTVFKDKLLEDFARYLSVDLLNYASTYEINIDYRNYTVFDLLTYENQRNMLRRDVNIVEGDEGYKLSNVKKFELVLPKDIAAYPNIFKNWEQYIEHQCLSEVRKTIDTNNTLAVDRIIDNIEEDLKDIIFKYSLREAVKYISLLEEEIAKQRPNNKSSINSDTSRLNKELTSRVNNYPNLIGYIFKCLTLGVFFLYAIVNIIVPFLSPSLNIVFLLLFLLVFCSTAYLDFLFTQKRFKTFLERYKEEIFKKSGALISLYIEKSIVDIQKDLLNYLNNKKRLIISCIENCRTVSKNINSKPLVAEESLGNLITDILNFKDRKEFYKEKSPKISDIYREFIKELEIYEGFKREDMEEKLLGFALKASQPYVDLDFFEYMKFKYKDDIRKELSNWIDKGIIKSKYLLQYINNDFLEEHSLFITSPEVHRVVKDMRDSKLSDFQVSVVEGNDIYTNCISIVRLCLGIDFNDITSVKKIRTNEKANEKEDSMRGDKNA